MGRTAAREPFEAERAPFQAERAPFDGERSTHSDPGTDCPPDVPVQSREQSVDLVLPHRPQRDALSPQHRNPIDQAPATTGSRAAAPAGSV